MERVIRYFVDLLGDQGYYRFQNDIADAMYGALGQGYVIGDNEVALVTKVSEAVNGKLYRGLSLHSRKIHGSRSYVQFNYQDKPITKELADSVFITVVTRGRERLLEKVCLVQNKVASAGAWDVDCDQLYLLKNFPLFSGTRGMFRGVRDVVFRNHSKCLGAFGLFAEPGEMTLISAPLLAEMACGASTIKTGDISAVEMHLRGGGSHPGPGWLPWYPEMLEEFWHLMCHFGPVYPSLWPGMTAPFLGTETFMRDLHDYARNWTLCNIGECCFALGNVLDSDLDAFTSRVLRAAGAEEFLDVGPVGDNMREFDASFTAFIAKVDIGES